MVHQIIFIIIFAVFSSLVFNHNLIGGIAYEIDLFRFLFLGVFGLEKVICDLSVNFIQHLI